MIEIYHLQKRHPDAGEFRIWSLLANDDILVRTVGRVMALNKQVYDDIPHGPPIGKEATRSASLQSDACARILVYRRLHDGFRLGRRQVVEPHHSRWLFPHHFGWRNGPLRSELSGADGALYGLRYGTPHALISDSGGAYVSTAFEAVCDHLEIDHKTIVSTQGESYMNLLETHFNTQRRLYDYRFSLTTSPAELEQVHHEFIQTYNTTAHQGLLAEGFDPPPFRSRFWQKSRAVPSVKTG
jgi:hypothetical protein